MTTVNTQWYSAPLTRSSAPLTRSSKLALYKSCNNNNNLPWVTVHFWIIVSRQHSGNLCRPITRRCVYILMYLIQFLSFCSFVDCGVKVRLVGGLRSVLVWFFFLFFPFRCTLKEWKLPRGQVPQWLSVQTVLHRSRVRLRGYDIGFLRFLNFFQSVL